MKIFLIPPHADFTLTWPTPPGFQGMDVARAFIRRALEPARLREVIAAREALAMDGPAEAARDLLLLHAARALLEAPGGEAHRHLRACGAALTGLGTAPSPVRLRLDDLELVRASTERSAEVLAAASQPGAPYEPDLREALETCSGAEVVRLWLERDQQLPAALFLARELAGRCALELAGPFARVHAAALSRLPPLAQARFLEEEGAWPMLSGSPLLPVPEPLCWRTEGMRMPPEGGAWGGAVAWSALTEPDRLIDSGCRVAVLAFCELDKEGVGADGSVLPGDRMRAALEHLRRAGVRLVGEWWIGAPGIGAEALDRTLAVLEQEVLFDAQAGVRTFHWPATRGDAPWGRTQVQVGPVPEDRDLARSRPFTAPETLPVEELPARMESLARALLRRLPLSPGRVAQAYVSPPAPRPAPGGKVCLDSDCALVTLPRSLEGKAGPASYAVNLRTGLLLALDARLRPMLEGLRAPVTPAQALPALAEAQRSKLVRSLVDKAVLMEVGG